MPLEAFAIHDGEPLRIAPYELTRSVQQYFADLDYGAPAKNAGTPTTLGDFFEATRKAAPA